MQNNTGMGTVRCGKGCIISTLIWREMLCVVTWQEETHWFSSTLSAAGWSGLASHAWTEAWSSLVWRTASDWAHLVHQQPAGEWSYQYSLRGAELSICNPSQVIRQFQYPERCLHDSSSSWTQWAVSSIASPVEHRRYKSLQSEFHTAFRGWANAWFGQFSEIKYLCYWER